MKDYNLEIVDAAFVAAGWAQHGTSVGRVVIDKLS